MIIFNIKYYLDFQKIRKILKEFYVILTSDDEYKKVISEIPTISSRNDKNLRGNFVRAVLRRLDEVDRSKL